MANIIPATLVLEHGQVYTGQSFGAQADVVFELVFNTSMTGYQEILTDPSYRGQGVLFTVSHVGNVGINSDDYESDRPQVSAMLIRAISPSVSNWRANQDLSAWLDEHGIPGIAGMTYSTTTVASVTLPPLSSLMLISILLGPVMGGFLSSFTSTV